MVLVVTSLGRRQASAAIREGSVQRSVQDSEQNTVAGHGAKVLVAWTEWAVGGRDPWGLESLRSCPA